MNAREIAKQLHGKKAGRRWQCRCPTGLHSHGDRNRSLSVWESDDGWVRLKCFTGCSRDEILVALGLKVRDLALNEFKPNAEWGKRRKGEELLDYWTKRRKNAVLAFAATRPKVPRSLWGDATDPDDFIRKGGDYRKVLACLGKGWSADDVPGYEDLTKRIEHIRAKLYPDEAKKILRNEIAQHLISEYGEEELLACFWNGPAGTRMRARLGRRR